MYSFYVPTLCHNKYHHNTIIIIISSSNIIIIIRIIIGLSNEKLNTSSYSVPIPSQLRQPSQPPTIKVYPQLSFSLLLIHLNHWSSCLWQPTFSSIVVEVLQAIMKRKSVRKIHCFWIRLWTMLFGDPTSFWNELDVICSFLVVWCKI